MEKLGKYILIDINDGNIGNIFKIYSGNEEYFNLSDGSKATMDNIYQDMNEAPPNIEMELKQYKAIKLEKEIIGVIDYVLEYPDSDTVYIGLFIIQKDLQSYGHGHRIFQNFEKEVKEKGFKRIRLAVLKNNESGLRFWKRNGLEEIFRTIQPEKNRKITVMEKDL